MPWTTGNPSLHFTQSGSGEVSLVLVHEMGGTTASWDAVVDAVGAEFAILRYDQRGAGASETPRDAFTLEDQIDDLERVIAAASVEAPFVLATIAAGVAIGAGYMLRHPEHAAGAVLFAPAFGVADEARAATIERARRTMTGGMRAIADMALARVYPDDLRSEAFAAYRGRFLANDPVGFGHANIAFADGRINVARLAPPCLLVAGGRDIRPLASIIATADTIPRATVELVAEGGHVLPHQQPAAATALLRRFALERVALFTHP